MKLLVVDSDAVRRNGLASAVARFYPDAAIQQESALERAAALVAQREPALVLLSTAHPARDVELFASAHPPKKPGGPCCPLLVISAADPDPAERGHIFECGATGFIQRPFADRELQAQMHALLQQYGTAQELREEEQSLQRALRDTEQRYRVVMDASPDAVFIEDHNGIVLDANPAACRLHELPRDQLIGRHVTDLVPPGQREAVTRDFPRWFNGELQTIESFSLSQDGRVVPIEIRGTPIDYLGQPALLLIARDTSNRRGAEERRVATVKGLRAVVEIADDLIACPDVDTVYRRAVELAREKLGLERVSISLHDDHHIIGTYGTDMQGQTTDERNHRWPLDDAWRERFRLRSPQEPRWSLALEQHQEWSQGTMRAKGQGWVAVTPIQTAHRAVGVFSNDAAITHAPFDPVRQEIIAVLASLLANIIERKSAEAERARLAMAVEQSVEAVVITNIEGAITYVNGAFERITGYTSAEILGKNPRVLKSGRHDHAFYEHMWARLTRSEVWRGRITNRRKDGTRYEAEQSISPMRDSAGAVIGYLTVSQDVTHAVKLENELRQAQKLDSLGRLAGGIAHDFNNLLTSILGFTKIVLTDLPSDHASRPDVEEILRASERAAKLTRQLLSFGDKQVIEIQPLKLNDVVLRTDGLLRRTLGENIELVTVLADDLPYVEADPGLLEQVLTSLALNGRDAMTGGGKLFLSTDAVEIGPAQLASRPEVSPGTYVRLSVRDPGHGMTDEVKRRVFEPFFTTKEYGRGRGLGLSTAYGIVRQFCGFIELDSQVGTGTEVRVFLPVATRHARQTKAGAIAPPDQRGKETILIVEDENTVRQLTLRLLRALGYRTHEARNGDEALAVLDREGDSIHLVLSDVIMPRMGGPELAARLQTLRPGLPILFMSGYTDDLTLESSGQGSVPLIVKPFTRDTLAAEVRRVLDAHAG